MTLGAPFMTLGTPFITLETPFISLGMRNALADGRTLSPFRTKSMSSVRNHATITALVFLVSAASLFAQLSSTPVSIDPPDPTSVDPVTLFVQQFDSCPPPPVMTRSGFEIDVTLGAGICLSPPVLITHSVDLGTLPAGRYNVNVVYPGSSVPVTFSFVVLDANYSVAVWQSVGSTAGGTTVNIVVAADHCPNQPPATCPALSITFGGIPATNVVIVDPSHFRATPPPHAAGAVQVTVADGTFTKSSYAFRYFDPAAPPSDKFFEKVLLPVIFNGPGAFGSNWTTDLSLRNDNGYSVEPWRPIGGSSSIVPSRPLLFGSGNVPAGLFAVVPRQAASGLAFHAAVRDTSRGDAEWATEIPVVREGAFSAAGVELLDIPADARFRTTVRIYSPTNPVPGYASAVHVVIYSLNDGSTLRNLFLSLLDPAGCSDAVSCAEHPSYAAATDVTAFLPSGRVGLQIQGSVPLWAFATITNNETQHVTVVSPH